MLRTCYTLPWLQVMEQLLCTSVPVPPRLSAVLGPAEVPSLLPATSRAGTAQPGLTDATLSPTSQQCLLAVQLLKPPALFLLHHHTGRGPCTDN